jgi:hypothetical protein
MKTTALLDSLAAVAVIAVVGGVAPVVFAILTTPAHAQAILDIDDIGHVKSLHDSNGDFHSHGKA